MMEKKESCLHQNVVNDLTISGNINLVCCRTVTEYSDFFTACGSIEMMERAMINF